MPCCSALFPCKFNPAAAVAITDLRPEKLPNCSINRFNALELVATEPKRLMRKLCQTSKMRIPLHMVFTNAVLETFTSNSSWATFQAAKTAFAPLTLSL